MQSQYLLTRFHDRRFAQQAARAACERVALSGPRLVTIQNQDTALVFYAGITHLDVQQEAIELRFRQRVRAFLFDRVLRRHDHEQAGGSLYVFSPTVICRSSMDSSSADCTLAGARLISSARIRLWNSGPSRNSKVPSCGR